MTLRDFIYKYNGKKVDYDGYYGAQCVDLARQYCKDVLEVEQFPALGDSGAKGIWNNPGKLKKRQSVKVGDLLVYGNGSYGHICILVAFLDKDTFIIFEQDGFKQDGAKLNLATNKDLLGGLYK